MSRGGWSAASVARSPDRSQVPHIRAEQARLDADAAAITAAAARRSGRSQADAASHTHGAPPGAGGRAAAAAGAVAPGVAPPRPAECPDSRAGDTDGPAREAGRAGPASWRSGRSRPTGSSGGRRPADPVAIGAHPRGEDLILAGGPQRRVVEARPSSAAIRKRRSGPRRTPRGPSPPRRRGRRPSGSPPGRPSRLATARPRRRRWTAPRRPESGCWSSRSAARAT